MCCSVTIISESQGKRERDTERNDRRERKEELRKGKAKGMERDMRRTHAGRSTETAGVMPEVTRNTQPPSGPQRHDLMVYT